ncbi:MAG TPA: nucleoside phosphorylase [Pseudothermotoga sp.]|nr:nucleoside phosphorylase [Pseudothermotoga sp.]HOK83815.1 nucleoside phosphorylase [Pseudothermotoga sp.]HPP70281.1 nucleoside phosphorylase [Pseudothermotoga sp.]
MSIQKHIRCKEGDVGKYVLIPGDEARAAKIAQRLEDVKKIAMNRAYHVYTGKLMGETVSVCSTGIGGPSASIAIEELARVGAKTMIRVGSAGGRQPNMPIGSLVIATAAYRGEGTSHAYAPSPFPAVADLKVTLALMKAAEELNYSYYYGIVFTRDAYYVQDEQLNRFLTDSGVVASEQECAIAFILGSLRHLSVGAILATDSNIWLNPQPTLEEKEKLFYEAEKKMIDVAIKAVQILIERDRSEKNL